MSGLDWAIVGAYVAIAVGIGALFSGKAGRSRDDYFLAGRSLGWFVAGTSIVATTFSSDTPLFVAGLSRRVGIWENWFWWSTAIGKLAAVFFFARLWRRSGVVTDIELVVLRYGRSRLTSALRLFKVGVDGLLVNCMVMASVTLAMAKIMRVLLGLSERPVFTLPLFGGVTPTALLLLGLGLAALIYASLSGLYGVVYTDLIQFALALGGSVALAALAYADATSGPGLGARLAAAKGFSPQMLSFAPQLGGGGLAALTFGVYIGIGWWSAAPVNGYYVQRLLATKSERDAMLAFLWFNLCHFVLRSWPWVLVGLLSLIYLPDLADPEEAFPAMIQRFLPAGLKGILVTSLLAAFMSTLDTLLNWVTAYVINDAYHPFLRPEADDATLLRAAKVVMLGVMVIALLITTQLSSVLAAYKYLAVIWGGTGTVMIARWYWWRVNAWAEISAIAASFIVGNAVQLIWPSTPGNDLFAIRLATTTTLVTLTWITVAFATSSAPTEATRDFYRRLRVGGPGWRRVREETGVAPTTSLKTGLAGWLAALAFVYGALLGTGALLLHGGSAAVPYLVVAAAGALGLRSVLAES